MGVGDPKASASARSVSPYPVRDSKFEKPKPEIENKRGKPGEGTKAKRQFHVTQPEPRVKGGILLRCREYNKRGENVISRRRCRGIGTSRTDGVIPSREGV